MKFYQYIAVLWFAVFTPLLHLAANNTSTSDSLYQIYLDKSNSLDDRAFALHQLGQSIIWSNPDSTLALGEMILSMEAGVDSVNIRQHTLSMLGGAYNVKAEFPQSLNYFHRAYTYALRLSKPSRVAKAIANIAMIESALGNYIKAIPMFQAATDTFRNTHDTFAIAVTLNNMALAYDQLGDKDKAAEYYFESLELFEIVNAAQALPTLNMNVGKILMHNKEMDLAEVYLRKSVRLAVKNEVSPIIIKGNLLLSTLLGRLNKIDSMSYYIKVAKVEAERIGNNEGIVSCLIAYAEVAHAILKRAAQYKEHTEYHINKLQLFDKAIEYLKQAQLICEEHNIFLESIAVYQQLGVLNEINGLPLLAIDAYQKALNHSKEAELAEIQLSILKKLSPLYEQQGDYQRGLACAQLHILLKDSVENMASVRSVTRQALEHDFMKVDQRRKFEAEKLRLNGEEREKRQQLMLTAITIGLAGSIVFIFIIINRFKIIKRQKLLIERQKTSLDNTYQELRGWTNNVKNSIKYGKRIQNALLTNTSLLSKYFTSHFLIFKPRDVVSGDFYWMAEKQEHIYFAVVDCTGHGVPGAFMSVIGITLLDQALHLNNIYEPRLIMEFIRMELRKKLNQSSSDAVMDSMEMLVCKRKLGANEMEFAGTANIMVQVTSGEAIIHKGDLIHLGVNMIRKQKDFNNYTIPILEGDMLYVFTDGYQDQFNEALDKTFQKNNLIALLQKCVEVPLSEQEEVLRSTLEEWQGGAIQNDDITFLAIRV